MRGEVTFRVRYNECDPMGVAHHGSYCAWFELGRTELLRSSGISYRTWEERGVMLAVVDLSIRYRRPARYDDVLVLLTIVEDVTRVRIRHAYELRRDGLLLATARTTLACLDRDGRPAPIPEELAAPTESD